MLGKESYISVFNKFFIAFVYLLLLEGILILLFFSSFETLKHSKKITSSNQAKEYFILPHKMSLRSEQISFELSSDKLEGFAKNKTILMEQKKDSLHDYYATQTNASWTDLSNGDMVKRPMLDYRLLGNYLVELASQIDRDPQNAELTIENGRAVKFVPHIFGQTLDLYETQKRLASALLESKQVADLSLETTEPGITLGQLNDLGIADLLVSGQSDFTGSSVSRVQNIKVGSAQYNGLILKSGEEFSFNEHLGPIDAEHGYKPELVIKPEGATPEFGGGLCQVSTTAFRAAFFAGLPITARKNHSYAVRYYEWISDDRPRAVGLDATIYSGVQDMKFLNDTNGAILIWTRIEGNKLFFDFYGTKDGREVVVDGPHPYDRRESGAVKSKVTRIVKKTGEELTTVTFQSNYVPPKTLPAVVEYPKPLEQIINN